jgi:hypothetical protein
MAEQNPQDLLAWVYAEVCKTLPEDTPKADLAAMYRFVQCGQAILGGMQPIRVDYLDAGIGLCLQDGTVLRWSNAPMPSMTAGQGRSLPITEGKSGVCQHGVVPSVSFPITRGEAPK